MAETSFPLANGEGVTDAAYERLMGPVTGSGRYAFSPTQTDMTNPLIYADSTGRQVKAYANQAAIVRGFRWESGTTPVVVPLDANTSGNPRLDLIVLRLNRSNFTVRLAKINGTPAATPSAPSPIQDAGSTGSWDLPLARVRVTSSGTTGQPVIAAADVTAVDWWLSPPAIVARSTAQPNPLPGQLLHQSDTGRTYRGVGSAWTPTGEYGAWTPITPASGWTNTAIFCRRINGLVFFQAEAVLNSNNKTANTDLVLCTLPTTFRPSENYSFALIGWMSPGQVCRAVVNGHTGVVTILDYAATFPNGGGLNLHPATWPAAY